MVPKCSSPQEAPSSSPHPCKPGLVHLLETWSLQSTRSVCVGHPRASESAAVDTAGWLARGLLMAVAIEAAAHRGLCGPNGRNPPSTDRTLLTLGPSPKVPQGCLQGCLLLVLYCMSGWVTSTGGQEPGSTNINGHSDHGRSSLACSLVTHREIVFGRSQASQAGQGCTDSGPAPTDLPGTKDGSTTRLPERGMDRHRVDDFSALDLNLGRP